MIIVVNGIQYKRVESPGICPHCHVANKPRELYGEETKDTDNVPSYISVWECTYTKCTKLFVVLHKLTDNGFQFIRFLNGVPNNLE